LLPENLLTLKQIAQQHPVQLSEWTFGKHPVSADAPPAPDELASSPTQPAPSEKQSREPKRRPAGEEASKTRSIHPFPTLQTARQAK
jgi:hypothetical protein